MQCTGNLGCFPQGKVSSHSTALPSFFFSSCVHCFCVSIPPAVKPTLLRQMDMGSLMCAQIWVHAVHTGGSGTNQSALGGTEKLFLTLPSQGIDPGSSDLNSDSLHWAMSQKESEPTVLPVYATVMVTRPMHTEASNLIVVVFIPLLKFESSPRARWELVCTTVVLYKSYNVILINIILYYIII